MQLPSLHGEEAKPSSNGAGAPPAPEFKTDPFAVDERLHYVPFALLEAQMEENQRLRMREALWISIVFHALALVALYFFLPKLLASHSSILTPLQAMLQNHEITFMELPPTPQQKPPVNTDKISDQNRVAQLRHPDQKLLKELLDAHPPGPPEKPAPPEQNQAQRPASPAAPQSAQQQAQRAGVSAPPLQPQNNGRTPQLTAKNQGANSNPFNIPRSAGSQLQEAMRASAENRGYSAGDLGSAPSAQATQLRSNVDVLSDTMGVDFGPYLNRVLAEIREHWYELIPEEARAPLMKQGKVSIQFVIMKDGSVAGMRAVSPSGDVALDRAAWGGITASNPFQPLPDQFKGQYLALRLHFLYNPERGDLQ